jgi:ribosomal-protein-alanine N-acetyltransferase
MGSSRVVAVLVDVMHAGDVHDVASIEGPTKMGEDQLHAELARPWTRAWVVREDARVVGYLVTWHVADELHVMNVATREDRRRRGIARAMMSEAVAYARAHRIRHVLLEVRRSNASAISLYRALGFFAMGVRSRYYPDDEDAVEMVLMFDVATGQIVAHADEVRV